MQNYPPGTLYMVATPIGNLADISLRALHLLTLAQTIACEDTRHTQTLLRAYGIDKPKAQLLALHQHNEAQAAQSVIERLQSGQTVAFVSDAGTPAISDPGARLAQAVRQAGFALAPLPGASSVTAILSVAGMVGEEDQTGNFVFAGFLSAKTGERIAAIEQLTTESRAVVLLEAPHRMEALAAQLAVLGSRLVTVGREMTKQFEEISTLAAQDLSAWLAQDSNRLRGEFALALHPMAPQSEDVPDDRILKLLLAELPLKTAVKLASDITAQPRNALYQRALALKSEQDDQ
jgi:16S rRNA (cytidine1402-2'-O)-methyltransferase